VAEVDTRTIFVMVLWIFVCRRRDETKEIFVAPQNYFNYQFLHCKKICAGKGLAKTSLLQFPPSLSQLSFISQLSTPNRPALPAPISQHYTPTTKPKLLQSRKTAI
jgi:hypothetical protein